MSVWKDIKFDNISSFLSPGNQQKKQKLLITNRIFRTNVNPHNLFKSHPERKILTIGSRVFPDYPTSAKNIQRLSKLPVIMTLLFYPCARAITPFRRFPFDMAHRYQIPKTARNGLSFRSS